MGIWIIHILRCFIFYESFYKSISQHAVRWNIITRQEYNLLYKLAKHNLLFHLYGLLTWLHLLQELSYDYRDCLDNIIGTYRNIVKLAIHCSTLTAETRSIRVV